MRLEIVALLPQLDPIEHRDLFELAHYDPNPEIKRLAQKITAEKEFHEMKWQQSMRRDATYP